MSDQDRGEVNDPSGVFPRDDGAAKPLPPLPDGGLAQAMPEWLKEPPDVAFPPRATVAAGDPDVRDPASFISEDDLPLWIRQLAAAEATRAEEIRREARVVEDRVAVRGAGSPPSSPASTAIGNAGQLLHAEPPSATRVGRLGRKRLIYSAVILVLLAIVAATYLLSGGI